MGAGGQTDFGGLAQAGMGEGFAKGVESGLEQYNKGVDKKVAQANMYLNNFIAPNLERLSKPLPRPSADASPEEFDAWIKQETARRNQFDMVQGQAGNYLKITNSPLSVEEFTGLFYDSSSALDPEQFASIVQNQGKFNNLTTQLTGLRQKILEIEDPTGKDKDLYDTYVNQYNTLIKDSGYAELYKTQRGVDYVEMVGTEEETRARRMGRINRRDAQVLETALSVVEDPAIQAKLQMLYQNGISLSTIDPDTGKTFLQGINNAIDLQSLETRIESGDEKAIISALQKISVMPDEEKALLTGQAAELWNQYNAYKTDPNSVPLGANKSAFQKLTLVDQSVTQGANTIKLQGIEYEIKGVTLANGQLDYLAAFGELAKNGNPAVLLAKPEFFARMREQNPNLTDEELETMFQSTVVDGLADYDKRMAQEFRLKEQTILEMDLNNNSVVYDRVEDGSFHLMGFFQTDADGNFVGVDKDNPMYQRILAANGGALSDEILRTWFNKSKENLSNKDTLTQQAVQRGAAEVRSARAQATVMEVEAKWADLFKSEEFKVLSSEAQIAKVNAMFAGPMAQAELATAMGAAVEALGVGILDDPAWKTMLEDKLGVTGYANAKNYLTAREAYRVSSEENSLTIQGQQITKANNDEFDRMFANPRAWVNQPEAVARIARAAGIDPAQAQAALAELAMEGKTLTGLQIETLRFNMFAENQRLDLEKAGLQLQQDRFAWDQTTDARDYARGVYEFDTSMEFQYTQFRADQSFRDRQFQYQVEQDIKDYGLRVRQLDLSEADSIRNFQAMFLSPLNQKLSITTEQLMTAQSDFKELVNNNPAASFISTNITWVPQPDGTVKAVPKNAAAQATFNTLNNNGTIAQIEEAKNRVVTLQAELDAGKALYDTVVAQGTELLGNFDVPSGPRSMTASTATQTSFNPRTYASQAPTTHGRATANFVTRAAAGQFTSTYANIANPNYCTTFIQAYLGQTVNVPGGVPGGFGSSGANGLKAALVSRGATVKNGSGPGGRLTGNDIRKLPDGTLLFQNTGESAGHTAMVLNGMVVQNSIYTNDKTLYGAIGVMDPDAFANTFYTSAVEIPESWKRNRGSTGVTPPRGGSSTSSPSTPTRSANASRYTGLNNQFAPSLPSVGQFLSSKIGAGVRMAASPGGASGLTYRVSNNRYAVISDSKVATQAVDVLATQFGSHYQSVTGTSLRSAYNKNPQSVRNMLVTELKNAGYSGDLNGFVTRWFRSRSW